MPIVSGREQRRKTILGRVAAICAILKEQRNAFGVPRPAAHVERRCAVIVGAVNLCDRREKPPRAVDIPVHARLVERRSAIRVGRVRVALVCLFLRVVCGPRFGTGFFGNTFQIGVSLAGLFLQTGVLTNGDHSTLRI